MDYFRKLYLGLTLGIDPSKVFQKDYEIDAVDFIKVWKHYDKDRNGYLHGKELQKFLKDILLMKNVTLKNNEIEAFADAFLREFDVDSDGKINMREVSSILPVEKNFLLKFNSFQGDMETDKKITKEEVAEIFSHYDKNKDYTLGGNELLAFLNDILERYNQTLSPVELKEYAELVKELFDVGPSGQLKLEHLEDILCR